jgi:hypothetical protein
MNIVGETAVKRIIELCKTTCTAIVTQIDSFITELKGLKPKDWVITGTAFGYQERCQIKQQVFMGDAAENVGTISGMAWVEENTVPLLCAIKPHDTWASKTFCYLYASGNRGYVDGLCDISYTSTAGITYNYTDVPLGICTISNSVSNTWSFKTLLFEKVYEHVRFEFVLHCCQTDFNGDTVAPEYCYLYTLYPK